MINVKAMRPDQARDPKDGEIHAMASEPRRHSRLPVFILLSLIALATFLKGLLFESHAPATVPAAAASSEVDPAGPLASDTLTALAIDDDKSAYTPNAPDKDVAEDGLAPADPVSIGIVLASLGALAITPIPPVARIPEASPPVSVTAGGNSPPGGNAPPGGGVSSGAVSGGGGEANTKPAPNGDKPSTDPVDPQARNRAPQVGATVRLADMTTCHAVMITVLSLLAGTHDPDGDRMNVIDLKASSGTLVAVEGGWLYTPASDVACLLTFTYKIGDGTTSVQQTAVANLLEYTDIVGTPLDDIVLGTDCADTIDAGDGDDLVDARGGDDIVGGGSGNDNIVAGSGADIVFGGDGDDIVFGGGGNDIIDGGAGNDMLHGGDGDDIIFGGDGNDQIFGDDGDDLMFGGAGNDIIEGGDGVDYVDGGTENDALSGGAGNDLLVGGTGNDTLAGDAGDDILNAGDGDDVVVGGEGADRLFGEAGNDTLDAGAGADIVDGGQCDDSVIANIDAAPDVYDGGDGFDTIDFSQAIEGVLVDFICERASGHDIGTDAVKNFEAVIGGHGDDRFVVGDEAMILIGGEGNDVFSFEVSSGRDRGKCLIHEIRDLEPGDRIFVKQFELRDSALVSECSTDIFGDVYGGEPGDERPFRFRIEAVRDEGKLEIDVFSKGFDDIEYMDFSIHIQHQHQTI